jgi:hypothetical protein
MRLRKPRRITITLPLVVAEHLMQRNLREGCSLSTLAAVLQERAITAEHGQQGCHG